MRIRKNITVVLMCFAANVDAGPGFSNSTIASCSALDATNRIVCEGTSQQFAGESGAGLLVDSDRDGTHDRIDRFPRNPMETIDLGSDGIGVGAGRVEDDRDTDGDGQPDRLEVMCGSDPFNKNSIAADYDADNVPDCYDLDDDNDGVAETC